MSSFLKLCLKSILSYSESFETHLFSGETWVGTPILKPFSGILSVFEVFNTFQGAKNIFFLKVNQIWSITRKKIKNSLSSFFHNRGGVKPEMTNVIYFFF